MSTQDETKYLDIYDMYLLDNGGIPLFAGCTASDYCLEHMEQHPLHTGFMAAISSFGKEVFAGFPKRLDFGHLKVTFKNEGDYSVVFVNPPEEDDELISEKMSVISKHFKEHFLKDIKLFYVR